MKHAKKMTLMVMVFVTMLLVLAACQQTVTLTFDSRGGSVIQPMRVEQNHVFETLPQPEREGYTFKGWYRSTDFEEPFDPTVPFLTNLTVYAKWEINQYTVTFDSQGGEHVDAITNDFGRTFTPPTPEREGHDFLGWYLDPSYEEPLDRFTIPAEDITLYAKWDVHTFVVSFYEAREDVGYDLYTTRTVEYGETLLDIPLVPERYGYNVSWGVSDFENITEDLDVYPVYEAIELTVHFRQSFDGITGDDAIEYTFTVDYGDSLDTLPPLEAVEGYRITWDRICFPSVTSDIEVRALYTPDDVKTVRFISDCAVLYQALETAGADDEILTEAGDLWQLSKTGYNFLGWFDSLEAETPLTIEDMRFSRFSEDVSYVYAQFDSVPAFNAPTDLEVSVDWTDMEDLASAPITVAFDLDPIMIDDVMPPFIDLLINQSLVSIPIDDFTVDGNRLSITIDPSHEQYWQFSSVLRPGVHSIMVRAVGDGETHRTGMYSDTYSLAIDTIIEGDVLDVAIYDYFIIETIEIDDEVRERFVFYGDMTYTFPEDYDFEITQGHHRVSAEGRRLFMTNDLGSFEFTLTRDGETTTYDGLIVANVRQFTVGSHYDTYLEQTTDTDFLREDTFASYQVGHRNPFVVDLRTLDNSGNRIAIDEMFLEFVFYKGDSEDPLTSIERDTYVEMLEDNTFRFREAALGEDFTIIVRPRYQAHQMTVNDAVFNVTVNDGHNVFTNAELQVLFGDLGVQTINIHRNIEAALQPHQMNEDGSPVNIRANAETGVINGNVYGRANSNTSGDDLVIHGNYLTIDGSNLPHSNRDSGSGVLGYSAAFEVINVQISMFYYEVYDASRFNPSDEAYVNDNHFSVNNLTILGNTRTPAINYGQSAEEIANQEAEMSKNSGGYNGLMVRAGSSTFDNVRLGYTLIPFFNTAYGYDSDATTDGTFMTLNYAHAYNTWANSLYGSGATGFKVNNSFIGQSGGAAIHSEDNKVEDGVFTPSVIIDGATVIDNWVSGDEAWFRAFGMNITALTFKSQIESTLNETVGQSIIDVRTDPITGLPTEMFNFVMLTEPKSRAVDDQDYPTTGSEIVLSIEDHIRTTSIHRPFDFLSNPTDPRVVNGEFLFAVGHLSDTMAFGAFVQDAMMNYGLSQQEAAMLGYIAGFYNLTLEQALQVAGAMDAHGLTPAEAVEAVVGEGHLRPQYVEVLTTIPIFDHGFSSVLVELQPLED